MKKRKDYSMPAKNKQSKFREILRLIRKYLSYLVFCTNLVAIFCMYLATKAWDVSGTEYPIVAYLGLFFPVVFAGNITYAVLWLLTRKWRFLVVQILAFIILWQPISTYYPLHFIESEVPEGAIKVLSYNVRGFNWHQNEMARKNPMFDYLRKIDADIICFQEFAISGNNSKKGLISERELGEVLKDYPYHSIIRLGNTFADHTYGLACYSKYPITKSEKISYPQSTYNGSALHEININGKKVTLVNNHLESNKVTAEDKKLYYKFFDNTNREMLGKVTRNIHQKMGLAFTKRETQANILQERLEKQNSDATIICGDFNDTPFSRTYSLVKGDLIDSFAQTGFGAGITYHENMFLFRIDYIMHSQNIKSYNAKVGKVKYSDHYPIWTYLKFND